MTEDPLQTTRLIGRVCKHSNMFSLPALIGREAWPHFLALLNVFMCLYPDTICKIFFGGNGKEATPVPIPNTQVKLFSADGTAWEAKWESKTLPETLS